MEIMVFASTGCKLLQNNEEVLKDLNIDSDFRYVCDKFVVDNQQEFTITETFNSFIGRLFANIVSIFLSTTISSKVIEFQNKAYAKNNKLASYVFMPLFKYKGRISIKPVNCTDKTLICLHLLKDKTPFLVEVFDGQIKILENKRL